MIFREKESGGSYIYTGEDVRGKAVITSPVALTGKQLDQSFSAIVNTGAAEGKIGDHVTYTFTRPNPKADQIDIFSVVPDLKEGTMVEQLITALAKSLDEEGLANFRKALQEMDCIEFDTEPKVTN